MTREHRQYHLSSPGSPSPRLIFSAVLTCCNGRCYQTRLLATTLWIHYPWKNRNLGFFLFEDDSKTNIRFYNYGAWFKSFKNAGGINTKPLFMPVKYAVPESLLERLNLSVPIFNQNNWWTKGARPHYSLTCVIGQSLPSSQASLLRAANAFQVTWSGRVCEIIWPRRPGKTPSRRGTSENHKKVGCLFNTGSGFKSWRLGRQLSSLFSAEYFQKLFIWKE